MSGDFKIEDHGSLWLVRPLNDEAHDWLDEVTDGTWFGGALAVEPRYVQTLADGIEQHGYEIVGAR